MEVASHAWDIGIRYFDVAPLYGYGSAERRIGRALAGPPAGIIRAVDARSAVSCTRATRSRPAPTSTGRRSTEGRTRSTSIRRGSARSSTTATTASCARSRRASSGSGSTGSTSCSSTTPMTHWEAAISGAYPALARLRAEGTVGAIGAGMNQAEMLARFAREGDFDAFMVAGRYTLLDQARPARAPAAVRREGHRGGSRRGDEQRARWPIRGRARRSITFPPTADRIERAAADPGRLRAARRPAQGRRGPVPVRPSGGRLARRRCPAGSSTSTSTPSSCARPIPADLWSELKAEGLLDADAPTPGRTGTRDRRDGPDRRCPPPFLGPGPGRLPMADRRPRPDPAGLRAGRPRSASRSPWGDPDGPRPDPLEHRRDARVPGHGGGDAVHRRRRRLGRPDRPGARRTRSPGCDQVREAAGWSGSATRSTTSPIPTGCGRAGRPGGHRRGRRCRPRLRPARSTGAPAGRGRRRPGAARRALRRRSPRQAADRIRATSSRGLRGSGPLGELANVWCKLSGMVTEADWTALAASRPAAVRRSRPRTSSGPAASCSDRTGRSACWPARTSGCSTPRPRQLGPVSADERAAVFGGNATEVYRLAAGDTRPDRAARPTAQPARPTLTTGFSSRPSRAISIVTRSPGSRLNGGAGTIPVPVRRIAPAGKLSARNR